MRVLLKQPGLPEEVIDVPNTLQAMQELVGGYIETITLTRHSCCIVNEEGRLKRLLPNFYLNGGLIVGNAVFVGVKGDGFRDITDDEITQCRRKIKLEAPKNERS